MRIFENKMFVVIILDKLFVLEGLFSVFNLIVILVDLEWKLLIKDGGFFIIGYVIEFKFSIRGNWIKVVNVDGSIIKYLFKDFREGIEYLFRVFVINEEGIGFFSVRFGFDYIVGDRRIIIFGWWFLF